MGLQIPSPNLLLLHQINWFCAANLIDLQKGKKQHQVRSGSQEVFCKKAFLKFHKIHREIPVLESFSNNTIGIQAVRLATLLKRDLCNGDSEPAVGRCSTK